MALINYLTKAHLAPGALGQLPAELAALGIHRPLLITDPGLATSETLRRVQALCPAETAVFADTPQNPTEEAAEAACAHYLDRACDGLIALGGGSPMDLAKAVAVLTTHDGPLDQYTTEGGDSRITSRTAPLIAIPTTAGTGSEVGRSAVISFRNGSKRGMRSPHLLPRVALCDAELTLTLPPHLTAATGMDALTHCVETYLSPVDNPVAAAIALEGARLAFQHIEAATRDGGDLATRHHMMTAALMGGLAFQKGLGGVHALAHPLGGLRECRLHHGTLNAILLPAVLRHNHAHIKDKLPVLIHGMGLPAETDLASAIDDLNTRLGLPHRLREVGVPADCLDAIAEAAMRDPSTRNNPRPMTAEGYRQILANAY